jgi:hypothetical protein
MKRFGVVGLCLVAMLTMSAAAATNALAFKEEPPEIGRCLKLAGGRFKDSGCKTAAKLSTEQKYEWYPGFGPNGKGEEKPFEKSKLGYKAKSKELTAIKLETVKGEGVTCKEQTSEGELTGPKTNRAFNIVFTGCESAGLSCISTNPKATHVGEILVKELNGRIGIEKVGATAANDKSANLFVPAEGEILTEFECSGLKLVVKGEVMVPLPTNAMKKSATIKFVASKGKQKPEKFATDPSATKRVLFSENSLFEEFVQAGQTLTTIQTGAEAVEASTVN